VTYFDTARVASSTLEEAMINLSYVLFSYCFDCHNLDPKFEQPYPKMYLERIQTPAATLSHQVKDTTEIVGEDNAREPRAIDETGDLEDFFLLNKKTRVLLRVI
jgi:hypothetical protein